MSQPIQKRKRLSGPEKLAIVRHGPTTFRRLKLGVGSTCWPISSLDQGGDAVVMLLVLLK